MLEGPSSCHSHPIDTTPFEAFYNGSWHGVDHIRIRNGSLFVKFDYYGSAVEGNIDGDCLRIRSRRATCFDCSRVLKPGVDVCVLSPHPSRASSDGELKAPLLSWRDARLISVRRNPHEDHCVCLFAVIFYKNECPGSMEKAATERRAKVVMVDSICILQKLQYKAHEDGTVQWNSTEDCLSYNKTKLLNDRFSTEVAWLVVLSALRGMEFDMKLVDGKIIYQIIKGDQMRSNAYNFQTSVDCLDVPPGFAENMKIVSFRQLDETLCPVIQNVTIVDRKETIFSAGAAKCTLKSELDNILDVEILYEHMNLRHSKRLKVQPDRFMSYRSPNFDRCYKKKPVDDLHTEEEKTPRATSSFGLRVKEEPYSEAEQKNTPKQRTPDFQVRQSPAQNKVKLNGAGTRVFRSLNFSQRTENRTSGFGKRRGRKRKKNLTEREWKKMLERCIGNIKCEMDREAEPFLQNMEHETAAHTEVEDFTWSPSTSSQEDKDELEELWKDMEYSLTTLALLEQKEMSDSGLINESTHDFKIDGEKPCHHDCILNEEFGITCRLCKVVCTEIRYIYPPLFTGDGHKRLGVGKFGHGEWMIDTSFCSIPTSEFSQLKGSDDVWSSIPDLEPKLHSHQRKAFEFIWKNFTGSLKLEEMNNSTANTGGCVIAHSPGSGKTLLVISFLVSYLKVYPRSRPLVLAPKAAIHTWHREFQKWGISIPVHVIHHDKKGYLTMRMLDSKTKEMFANVHQPSGTVMRIMDTLEKVRQWHEHPSVLLVTYSSFLSLTKEGSKLQHQAFVAKVLLNNPGLLVLDEGHNPRSTRSKLRKLLMKVKTEFRVILSGTLFQNNFEEYFNTLSLARPRFVHDVITALDPRSERLKRGRKLNHLEALARGHFVEKVGQKIEASNEDDRIDGLDLLSKLTCGFIDAFEGATLNKLPGLQIYTLFMKPTDAQQEILTKLTESVMHYTRYPLEIELLITIGSIHPWLIKTTDCATNYFSSEELKKFEKYKKDISIGSKAKFVVDLVHKATVRGERVLIFCHNVTPINFLVWLLELVFGWCLGEEVLVLQGDQDLSVRSDVMDKFNSDNEGKRKVLLASTTACAEGISLTAASRLIMLDSEWNHSKTRQAIARAFRPGQERVVYVYLLLASGTWEEEKYNINTRKAWVSKMVFHGRYVDYPSPKRARDINDEVLKELVNEDDTKTFDMIVKQD